jgi:arginase
MSSIEVHLIGYASGIAAADAGCADGPLILRKSSYLAALAEQGIDLHWDKMIQAKKQHTPDAILNAVTSDCRTLAIAVESAVNNKQFFTVLGGDHSCAIGTWSGVASAINKQGSLGLIWVDAHMDSHTPATSQTGNLHGMPLACLLGYGVPGLIHLLSESAKLKPENICLIGIRSFEAGEADLLKRLNVRIFFMDEIEQRGLDAVMAEALTIVNTDTVGYGVTVDIDSVDPIDAPGTGVKESGGLSADALCDALTMVAYDGRLLGTEIVEFDPHMDKDHKTEKLVADLLAAMTIGKRV